MAGDYAAACASPAVDWSPCVHDGVSRRPPRIAPAAGTETGRAALVVMGKPPPLDPAVSASPFLPAVIARTPLDFSYT